MDPASLNGLITCRTKAIITVSLFGQMPDMKPICTLARLRGLYLLEDGAQSFGACQGGIGYSCGVRETHIGITSFFPTKPLNCYGDGGAAFTDDEELAHLMTALRQHGRVRPDEHETMGLNARLDGIQAAVLLLKLGQLDKIGQLRRQAAQRYIKYLSDLGCASIFDLPKTLPTNERHVHAQFVIALKDQALETGKLPSSGQGDLGAVRCQIQDELRKVGVPTAVYYKTPLHKQRMFSHIKQERGSTRISELCSRKVLALPFHTYIEEYEIRRVCSSIQQTLIQLGYLQGCASLAECPADDSEPVHVAVIGVGGWGLNHVKALASLNLLYAVCDHVCLYSLAGTTHVCASHASEPESCQMFVDQDRSVLTRVKEDFPDVVVYHQYSVLLDDSKVRVQGVVIALPSELHYEVADASLKAGKHVLVEKPLALNLADAQRLHSLAQDLDRRLMVGHLLRFHQGVIKLLSLVRSGRIGKVRHIHCSRLSLGKWRRENVLWSFAPHDISLCAAIVQAASNKCPALPLPDSVTCALNGETNSGIADVGHIQLAWAEANVSAHIHVSWIHPIKQHQTIVVGDKVVHVLLNAEQAGTLKSEGAACLIRGWSYWMMSSLTGTASFKSFRAIMWRKYEPALSVAVKMQRGGRCSC
eukprot:scaffold302_cov397-Prasinococcus_capsulatus_cf.AAC.19